MNRALSVPVAASALLLGTLLVPFGAGADYVRDELRVILRAGPGTQHARVAVLMSGDEVRSLGENKDWTRVRTADGSQGWIPSKYLRSSPPPVRELPRVEAELGQALEKITGLEERLGEQTRELVELEALRARVADLEAQNTVLARSSYWRTLIAGGAIVLLGMLIGALLPKSRPERPRRLRF
jgi:SH3 domain protein